MDEPPGQAQARFIHELGQAMERGLRFRLDQQAPGMVTYSTKLDWGMALLLLPAALWPKLAGYRLAVSFVPERSGTQVRISGKANK
jgi:hypothetical protein